MHHISLHGDILRRWKTHMSYYKIPVLCRNLFKSSLLNRQSKLASFHDLFASNSDSSLSSSSSSSSSNMITTKRFPIMNVSVDSPLGTSSELLDNKNVELSEERQLGCLRHNLKELANVKRTRLRPRLKMPEGNPLWPRYKFPLKCSEYIYDPTNESKLTFITSDNYCHLCREPVEFGIRHCAWWDHVTRQAAIRLIAIYPRRWNSSNVINEAQETLPNSVMTTPRPHPFLVLSKTDNLENNLFVMDMSSCFIFEKEAVVRRAELAAILRLLCKTKKDNDFISSSNNDNKNNNIPSVIPVIYESLIISPNGNPAANIGERTFRAYISRQITILLPPMAPEPTTRIQQRCWGRKNLEIMFDLLGISSLQKLSGSPTLAETKNEKATIFRQIIYELVTVLSEGHFELKDNIYSKNNMARIAAEERTRLLVELTLQRLAHELIYLHTSILMEQTWEVYAKLGFPSEKMIEKSDFC